MHNLRTLLIVLDGVSYSVFNQFRYSLSTINNLAENGNYGKLESVFPAITPVALASLFTGVLPSTHGITAPKIFIKGASLSKPLTAYSSIPLKADPIWSVFAKKGYKVVVTTAPQALPDRWGLDNLLLFDPYKARIKNCSKGYLLKIGNNVINEIRIDVENSIDEYIVKIIDVENNTTELHLRKNEWSKPIEATMKCKDKTVKGVFMLKGLNDSIYLTPPSFLTPNWSNNFELEKEVWENVVKIHGMNLDGDYLSLKSNIISFKEYFDTIKLTFEFFYNYSLYLLNKLDWDFAITYLPIIDNIQHLLFGVNDSTSLDYLFQAYKMADDFVKPHIQLADNIIICSDHGINKVKKRVYINKFLEKLNVLKINNGEIDWKRTKAYYGGGGLIRINLKEREKFGIVKKNEFAKLVKYITSNLEKLEDPENNERILTLIVSNEMPADDRQGDIVILGVNSKYSISNGIEKDSIFEDVIPYTSITADHGYYNDEDMNGIIIFYGKIFKKQKIDAKIVDIMPTILKIYGINWKTDGKILDEVFKNEFTNSNKQKAQKT
ncbi:MAG: alkaline phosphatase family protein [Saccharolobus sp.]